MKNKTVEKLMRFLITLLGAGIGAALAALILPLFSRWYPIESPYAPIALYAALCLVGAAVCFAFSSAIIGRTMKLIAAIERRWDAMPTQQIVLTSIGMIMGLVVAALITQLILSAGASLITISFSALTYVDKAFRKLRFARCMKKWQPFWASLSNTELLEICQKWAQKKQQIFFGFTASCAAAGRRLFSCK